MSRINRYEYQDWKNFGARVKNSRKQIGMTKERFAEEINRTENFVSEIEKGNKSCSLHTLHQISKVLKVSADYLLYGENVDMKKEYSNKEILEEIINRCNEEELGVIKDLIVAVYPNLKYILKDKSEKKDKD